MSESTELKQSWLSDYKLFRHNLPENPFNDFRDKAIKQVEAMDFPTRKHEEWKYTNLQPLFSHQFAPLSQPEPDNLLTNIVYKYSFTEMNKLLLVFVNGKFSRVNSRVNLDLPADAYIGSLKDTMTRRPDILKKHLGRLCKKGNDIFSELSAAFLEDGALVYIPDNLEISEPLHLMYLSTDGNEEFFTNPRNLIIIGKHSKITIIETYDGLNQNAYMTNSNTEILVKENAQLTYHKLQLESLNAFHMGSVNVKLERDANFFSTNISFGSRLNRNNLDISLSGPGANADLFGLYMGKDSQHFDNRTLIHHLSPHTTSNQVYKGILDEQSRGVFNGRINVERDAQKITANQLNKNLLLSDKAKADTKPQLKIFADDVKCSHGATVGQLDENALFYLRSRGIGEETARSMLTYAFASDIVDSIIVGSVRFYLYSSLLNRLGKGWENI